MTFDPTDLVHRVAADPAVWPELIRRYRSLIRAVGRSQHLNAGDIDDLCQLCWLRLAERLPTLRDPGGVAAWLVTTARREARRMTAARLREHPTDPLPPLAHNGSPERDVLAAEEYERLRQALAGLPDRCRMLLDLVACSPELSYGELAALLGITCGSVGPTKSRCLALLRRRFLAT
jgi:RNA polymerase sigma factor (sigma-70 family)